MNVPSPKTFDTIRTFDGQSGEQSLSLTAGTREDSYVCGLEATSLAVRSTTTNETDGSWSTDILYTDTAYLWIYSLFPDFIGSKLMMTVNGTYALELEGWIISSLLLKLELPTANSKTVLTFSSLWRPDSISYETSRDAYGVVNESGFYVKNPGTVFGLVPVDSLSEVQMTLKQICSVIGLAVPMFLDFDALFTVWQDEAHHAINALWHFPSDNNRVAYRLSFLCLKPSALAVTIDGMSFENTVAIITTMCTATDRVYNEDGSTDDTISCRPALCLHTSLKLGSQSEAWDAWIIFRDDGVDMYMQWNHTSDPLSSFWSWLKDELKIDKTFSDPEKQYGTFASSRDGMRDKDETSSLVLREIRLSLDHDGSWSLRSFSITFELAVNWGISAAKPEARVPVQLSFTYEPPMKVSATTSTSPYLELTASLWLPRSDRLKAIEVRAGLLSFLCQLSVNRTKKQLNGRNQTLVDAKS